MLKELWLTLNLVLLLILVYVLMAGISVCLVKTKFIVIENFKLYLSPNLTIDINMSSLATMLNRLLFIIIIGIMGRGTAVVMRQARPYRPSTLHC